MNYLIISVATTIFSSSIVLANNLDSRFPEHVGFGSGAAAGTVVAGPIGFIVGGTLGVLMGNDIAQSRILAQKNEELIQLNEAISDSQAILAKANVHYMQTEQKIFALEELLSDLSMTVYFATDSAITADRYQDALNAIAKVSKKFAGMQISLVGHADATGSDTHNQKLSEMRAKSVSHLLKKAGVPKSIITEKGSGESEAVAIGQHGHFALGRRVDLQLSFNRGETKRNSFSNR